MASGSSPQHHSSWAQINYRRQFGDDTYVANGGLKSTALTFSRDGKTQDKNWVDIAIGADFPLSATVSAFAGLAQTAGLSDGNQTRYNVGFSADFDDTPGGQPRSFVTR